MMPIEPVTLTVGAAVLLGLSFGAGPCNIACLPYLGPVFLASGNGVRDSWRTLLPFSLGRIAGYALLAMLAGWAGVLVQDWLSANWIPWLIGGATILVALSLLFRRRACKPHQRVMKVELKMAGVDQSARKKSVPTSLFLMGMGMTLNPCAPLSTVILASATSASMITGLLLGLGFGMGAVLVPALVFAFGVAQLSDQIRTHLSRWSGSLENFSIALLLLLGVGTALGWISL
jgi:cytochrome c biogenesis protein CcdA